MDPILVEFYKYIGKNLTEDEIREILKDQPKSEVERILKEIMIANLQ